MTTAALIDALVDLMERQAEIIRLQREMLLLHGIGDETAADAADCAQELRCLSCPLNGPK